MKNKIYLAVFTALFFVLPSYGSHSDVATVTGFVSSFDEHNVKLYVRGQFVVVPKSTIGNDSKIAIGKEVTAFVKVKRDVASEGKK